MARRERRAYPLRYVRSEQQSQRACGPQPEGARRRAGICCVAAPRRCHHIACVAAPCIYPPGARAKMHRLFPHGSLVLPNGLSGNQIEKMCKLQHGCLAAESKANLKGSKNSKKTGGPKNMRSAHTTQVRRALAATEGAAFGRRFRPTPAGKRAGFDGG